MHLTPNEMCVFHCSCEMRNCSNSEVVRFLVPAEPFVTVVYWIYSNWHWCHCEGIPFHSPYLDYITSVPLANTVPTRQDRQYISFLRLSSIFSWISSISQYSLEKCVEYRWMFFGKFQTHCTYRVLQFTFRITSEFLYCLPTGDRIHLSE